MENERFKIHQGWFYAQGKSVRLISIDAYWSSGDVLMMLAHGQYIYIRLTCDEEAVAAMGALQVISTSAHEEDV